MKKTYALIVVSFIIGSTFAQSQRLTLVEEFTQASCGPCASQNPALNTLLNNNTDKVISVKYQVSWPGVDPMNAQNPDQVATRRSYYNVSGVPHLNYDGKTIGTGSSPNAPAHLTQTKIDEEYAIPSPFTLDLTHTLNANYDSIFINAVITASMDTTLTGSNPIRLHLAIIEKEIRFENPPGSNGEKEFYNVMRKMLPSDLGTALSSIWITGQDTVISIAARIPSYIYDISQVAVVGFIQNNNNKGIMQAAFTTPVLIPNDAGVSSISNIPLFQCDTSITPSVTLKNFGSDTLTSAIINYKLNSGATLTQNWTGSLAPGETAVVIMPEMKVSDGQHTFNSFITMPNGVTDVSIMNDSKSIKFNVSLLSVGSPLDQSFQSGTFPPSKYFINNPDKGETWKRATNAGGLGNSSASARMFFNASPPGEIDELFLPSLDFTNTTVPIMFDFNIACSQFSASNYGQLEVLISTDCGSSWTSVFDKQGSELSTAPNNNQAVFVPTASQWRSESLDLSSYVDESHVVIKFKATSNSGNMLYIDDLNIRSTTGIKENSANFKLNVYPNPANSTVNIQYTVENKKNVKIKMVDALGKIVYSESVNPAGSDQQTSIINVTNLPAGIYFVQFTSGNVTEIKKISVLK